MAAKLRGGPESSAGDLGAVFTLVDPLWRRIRRAHRVHAPLAGRPAGLRPSRWRTTERRVGSHGENIGGPPGVALRRRRERFPKARGRWPYDIYRAR